MNDNTNDFTKILIMPLYNKEIKQQYIKVTYGYNYDYCYVMINSSILLAYLHALLMWLVIS